MLVSLALLTVYFRESDRGSLHGLQSAGASVLRPFEVGAERVARPFRDAAGWFGGLIHARDENKRLRHEIDALRQQAVQNQTAARDNATLLGLIHFRDSARFPKDFEGVAARVIGRAPSEFVQQIDISAGSSAGIRLHDAVVDPDGLVGEVTRVAGRVAQVTLLTDEASAVSAIDLKTAAPGIAQHGSSAGDSLILDRVTKDQVVNPGDVVVTAGWHQGKLSSLYPRGIPIGIVTSVGQFDTNLYKVVQVQPFVHFDSLDAVFVLVPKQGRR